MFKDINPANSKRAVRRVSLLKLFCAVFLAAGLAASAHAGGTLTGSSGNGWHALAISPAATGTFTATYDATPSISPENALIGLSNGAATGFGNNGCIGRFNPSGFIDAYNGTAYGPSTIPYSAGVSYHFRFVVDLTSHTYSVYVTPAGGTELTVGTDYAFRSTANTMTSLNDWNLDVDPSIKNASLTAINLSVGGGPFTISASAGSGGSISPTGNVSVNQGDNQTFTISPNAGFIVSSVTVDGTNVGAVPSYTFTNVQANHTIIAAFQPTNLTFTITSSAGASGTITPSGTTTVTQGSNQTFTMSANAGFIISNVVIDGVSQGPLNSYTFSNIQSNDNITVAFLPTATTFTLTASASSGGTISGTNPTGKMLPLSGPITVIQGTNQSFTIVPDSGFVVSSVIVDGASVGAVTSYTFSNVLTNHTISAAFQAVPTFTITASAGTNGTINPSDTITVTQGSNQSVSIAANSGFTVSNVTVDGASVGAVTGYTFSNVQANHTISATFATSGSNAYLTSAYILQAIRTVTDYAVEHPSTDSSNTKALPYTWVRATLTDALAQTYVETGDTHYLNSANVWAEGTRSETYWLNGVRTATTSPAPPPSAGIDVWEVASRSALPTTDPHWFLPGTNTYMDIQYHADDSCAGHTFLQLYDLDPNPVTDRYKIGKIAGIQTRIDYVISNPNNLSGRKIWWWADALYMAPPNFAHLAKTTGNPKYAAALDSMYWDTYAYLFSPTDNLFYRDDKYFPGQPLGSTKNNKSVIWSRGNGWVMGGLVEILTYLPPTDPKYASYVTLFQNMAAAIKARQQPSGLWHTSLDDPNDGYPGAGFKVGEVDGDETSGTVFFVYALGWGIQNGLLPGAGANGYDSVVKNAWMALQSKIQPNGSLGYAQVVGQVAGPVTATNTTDFAAGAFALAALEVKALYGTP
jgi:rhamnogalacturonyl hydrolase YesR